MNTSQSRRRRLVNDHRHTSISSNTIVVVLTYRECLHHLQQQVVLFFVGHLATYRQTTLVSGYESVHTKQKEGRKERHLEYGQG